jgi:hypothetical protein
MNESAVLGGNENGAGSVFSKHHKQQRRKAPLPTIAIAPSLIPAQGPSESSSNKSPRIDLATRPITRAKFWRNRRGEAVHVRLGEYKGCALVDLRIYKSDVMGIARPTRKGIAIKLSKLPELKAAIDKAYIEANRLLLEQSVP